MDHLLRFLLVSLALLGGLLPTAEVRSAPALERGAAITDPFVLRELDRGKLGLGRMLAPSRSNDAPLNDSELFALPSMGPLRKALDDEFERYVGRRKAASRGETIGVGDSFDIQLFDREKLHSPSTRFVLAGIVNRMDRAYLSKINCGEVRLIYRLVETNAPPVGDHQVSPRLPMTLNLVLRARDDRATDKNAALTCAEIARRWLASGDYELTGAALAEKLTSRGGPLESIAPENIDRIETNVQISHISSTATREFRTDYLLKVFDYNDKTRTFEEATLENQIDRERILADDKLRRDFKAWLLDQAHFAEFDRGTVLIPKEFLAVRAIAPTPLGFSSSDLQPAFGLVEGEAASAEPVFTKADVVAALEKAAARGVNLQNIRSVAGFERRLNDITCAGCHQTRAIGGFHFPGVDWMAANPSNSTVVPGSPHFFGDQVRRRDILAALRDGERVDYSRGFSSRPQSRGSKELAGTEYEDGWGAPCFVQGASSAQSDRSFKSWTCARGLACQVMSDVSRMGMCFVGSR